MKKNFRNVNVLSLQPFSKLPALVTFLIVLIASFTNKVAATPWQTLDTKITGKVTGTNNAPLGGVSVTVRGSSVGTATNNSGAFSLAVPPNTTLLFSYVGYNDTTIVVSDQTVINVQLTASTRQLEQVVVVGYGTQRKRDITSAISTVKTDDIRQRPVVNTAEVLAGKAPGVQVIQPSGKPGSPFSVNIRGIASPNGNQPLYVIDGVMTYKTEGLDPGNIESISILKDAAAAGIYGAGDRRAALF